MNISVHYDSLIYDEQGLLAVRFHPQHTDNGLLYAWYSVLEEGVGRTTRLSEFRVRRVATSPPPPHTTAQQPSMHS